MSNTTLLPAIRSSVGDWNYYVTTMSFGEVAKLIKAPDEIHERRKLSEWIQREVAETHAEAIADYLTTNPQRFLGSLIVGVYGGNPDWTPLNVKLSENEEITTEQIDRVEGCLGFLQFTGGEKLFAIDGQHRVSGIKLALEKDTAGELSEECVSAIFVSHDPDSEIGKQRTRRLFTTVNKKAKAISKAAKIALDEDDGFAIVARRLIDRHWLFEDERDHLLYGSGGAIGASDVNAITSVVGLFEIVKDLYSGTNSFGQSRPNESELTAHLELCSSFFDELITSIPEFKLVFVDKVGKAGDYRNLLKNHLLFRPAGQRAFARATELQISRGMSMKDSVQRLGKVDLYLQKEVWHHILWDPISKTMITAREVVAEAQLLQLANFDPRNKSSLDKLLDIKNTKFTNA